MVKSILKKLFLLGIVFLFTYSSQEINSQEIRSKYGGEIILALTSDPRSFNPILAKETSTTAITGIIFEGLTRTNAVTFEVEPNLAQSWQISRGGLQFIFYLRRDVFWSDGKRFLADDVIFTFNELIYNDNIPNSGRDIFTIEGKKFKVEKVDDYTVSFILPARFAPFLRSMSQEILPKHILEQRVREGKFNFTWGTDSKSNEIVGTGPFILEKYLPGEKIILKRNSLYWKRSKENERLPYLNKLIFMIVQNQDTALLKFKEGELDYYSLRGTDYPFLKPLEREENFTIFEAGADFGSNFIVFNQNRGINPKTKKPYVEQKKLTWFTNLKFRQAVAHAIDKKRIIDILMNGLGFPQDSSMSPSCGFFYNPNVVKYDYNLKKAKQILNEAGFMDRDNDGIIEDVFGNKVEFNLYTTSADGARTQIAAILRSDLEKLSMKVNFVSLEFNNLVGKLVSTYDWDSVIIGLTGGIEPHFGKNVWASEGALHMWYPGQKQPATDGEKRVDNIFNSAVQELNENKRKILYDEWQLIISQELPLIYTVLAADIFAVRNKFGNLKPSPYGGAFHNLEEIYIKTKN